MNNEQNKRRVLALNRLNKYKKDLAAANMSIDVSLFTSLTNVTRRHDDYFIIDGAGVRAVLPDISDLPVGYLSAQEDMALSSLDESLAFPCTPEQLVAWAHGTNGTFQLPAVFINAVAAKAETQLLNIQQDIVECNLKSDKSIPGATALQVTNALVFEVRLKPKGGDLLTFEIWEICYDLRDEKNIVKPALVMKKLKIAAENRIYPLVGSIAGGVKYEREKGEEKELTSEQLRGRIKSWKKAISQC